jgi:outer membrane lipoprotein-sorting protein
MLSAPAASAGQGAGQAERVLQHAIRAKGGIERLRSIRTIRATGTMTVATGGEPMKVGMTTYVEYPGRFRLDAVLPGGEVTQVYADGRAWTKDPSGVRVLEGAALEGLRASASRDTLLLLLAAAAGRLNVRLTQPQGEGLPDTDNLELSDDGVTRAVLFVNRTTAMITGEQYIVEQPGAIGKVPTEEMYSDYRDVDGVQIAFRTVVHRGEAVIVERTLSQVSLNLPLDHTLFEPPVK